VILGHGQIWFGIKDRVESRTPDANSDVKISPKKFFLVNFFENLKLKESRTL
jgi:hypothetical protein